MFKVTEFRSESPASVGPLAQPDSYFGCWALCTGGCSVACVPTGGTVLAVGLGASLIAGDAAAGEADFGLCDVDEMRSSISVE